MLTEEVQKKKLLFEAQNYLFICNQTDKRPITMVNGIYRKLVTTI